jgi:hypothetical protein
MPDTALVSHPIAMARRQFGIPVDQQHAERRPFPNCWQARPQVLWAMPSRPQLRHDASTRLGQVGPPSASTMPR